MSFKWIRMLVAPQAGADLNQMHLRRTLPQSKIISKFMKPTRVTPTSQQICKLDILKNNTGLLEQITTEKTSRLLPPDRMENLLKKSLSPSSKLRPSSRCHLRSSQNTTRRNFFNFCQSQNKLRRRMTLMERFHDICQAGNTQQSFLESHSMLRPQTRRFQIREYSTGDKSSIFKLLPESKAMSNNMDCKMLQFKMMPSAGNLELVLNTIKASKAQHDLKSKNLPDVMSVGQVINQKIFKGWNTAVPVLFQEPQLDHAGHTCTKFLHQFGRSEQLNSKSAKSLLSLKKTQKEADLISTHSIISAKPEVSLGKHEMIPEKPDKPYLTKLENPYFPQGVKKMDNVFLTTTENPFLSRRNNLFIAKQESFFGSKPENPLESKVKNLFGVKQENRFLPIPEVNPAPSTNTVKPQIEPSPTYQVVKNAQKNLMNVRDINFNIVVHNAKALLKPKAKLTFPYNLQTVTKTDPVKSSLPPDGQEIQQSKPKIGTQGTQADYKSRMDEIRNRKHLENTAMFSRLTLDTAPSKNSMKARLDPMVRQSRDLSGCDKKIPAPFKPSSSNKPVQLKIVMPSLNLDNTSFEPIVPPPMPVPCVNGRNCQAGQFSEADYKPYHDLAKEKHMRRFIPKSKRLLKVRYPSHKGYVKGKESNIWNNLNRGCSAKEPKQLTNGSNHAINQKKEELKLKGSPRGKRSRGGRKRSRIPVPVKVSKPEIPKPCKKEPIHVKNDDSISITQPKDPRGTIFVNSDQNLIRSTFAQRKRAKKCPFYDSKDSLRNKPCELCGLYHCKSTPQCPLTDWFKNGVSTGNEGPPQVLATYLNKRNYAANSRNRAPTSTEELLNVCKHCGLVHTSEHEICPMKEALKLFVSEKKPLLTKILMRNRFQSLQDRILNLAQFSEEKTQDAVPEKIVFQKPVALTNSEKLSSLQGSEPAHQRILPTHTRNSVQLCSFGRKGGILEDKVKPLSFTLPPFKIKRNGPNLKTIMKAKKESKYGSAFRALEKCKTKKEDRYPQFAENLCNMLQDLLQDCHQELRLSQNAKITCGNMKFLIEEEKTSRYQPYSSWVHDITIERKDPGPSLLQQGISRPKLTSSLEDTYNKSRYNFEIICSGLKPSSRTMDPSSTRINSAGSRSFNTCCRSAYTKYPRVGRLSNRRTPSIESILSQVQNKDKNVCSPFGKKIEQDLSYPLYEKAQVTDRWRIIAPEEKTPTAQSQRTGRIYDDVLRIEKLQKCIDILKRRVKEKTKPIRNSLVLSETNLKKKVKKIFRISQSTENILARRKKPIKLRTNVQSKTKIPTKQTGTFKDKKPVVRKARSDLKLPKTKSLKIKPTRKSKSMDLTKRRSNIDRYNKHQAAKAVTSLMDLPIAQARLCSAKEMHKRGFKITRPTFTPPSTYSKSPRTSLDPKPCCHNDFSFLKKNINTSKNCKEDSKSNCKKSPDTKPCANPRKICQDGSNLKEFVMAMLKIPPCELELIQARLKKQREKMEKQEKGSKPEEFYKFYKSDAYRTPAHKSICVEEFFKPMPRSPPICPPPAPFCPGVNLNLPKFQIKEDPEKTKSKKVCKVFKVVVKPSWKGTKTNLQSCDSKNQKETEKEKEKVKKEKSKYEVFLPDCDNPPKTMTEEEIACMQEKTKSRVYSNKLCETKSKEDSEKGDEMEKFFEFDHLRKKTVCEGPKTSEGASKLGMVLPNPDDVKAKLKKYAEECKMRLRKLSPFREKHESKEKSKSKKVDDQVKVSKDEKEVEDFGSNINDRDKAISIKCNEDDDKKPKVIDGEELEKVAVVEEKSEKREDKPRRKRSKRRKSKKRDKDTYKYNIDEDLIKFDNGPKEPKPLCLKLSPPEMFLPQKQNLEDCEDKKPESNKAIFSEKKKKEDEDICPTKEEKKDKVACASKESKETSAERDEMVQCSKKEEDQKDDDDNYPKKEDDDVSSRKEEKKEDKYLCSKKEDNNECSSKENKTSDKMEDQKTCEKAENEETKDSKDFKPCDKFCSIKEDNQKPCNKTKLINTDVQTDDDIKSCKGRPSWANIITDVVKGAKKIQYAKISKAEMDSICQSVLKEIKTRKSCKDGSDPSNPEKDNCVIMVEDPKKTDSKSSRKSWKYLCPMTDDTSKPCDSTSDSSHEDKTGIQLQKCLSDVRKCLDEYKQCLKDLDIVPKMAPHFDYNEEMSSEVVKKKPLPCEGNTKIPEAIMTNAEESESSKALFPKYCDGKFRGKEQKEISEPKMDPCVLSSEPSKGCKPTSSIDPLNATIQECQQLGNLQETASILVTPSYLNDPYAQDIHDSKDGSKRESPRDAFQRSSCGVDSKTRGMHCAIASENNASTSVIEHGRRSNDSSVIMETIDQVTVYYPREKSLNLELVVRTKKQCDLLKVSSEDQKSHVPMVLGNSRTQSKKQIKMNEEVQPVKKILSETGEIFSKSSPEYSKSKSKYNYTNLSHGRGSHSFSSQLSLLWDDMCSNLVLTPKSDSDLRTNKTSEFCAMDTSEDIWPRKYYPNAHPPFVNRKHKLSKSELKNEPTTSEIPALAQKREANFIPNDYQFLSGYILEKKTNKSLNSDGRNAYCHIGRGSNLAIGGKRHLRRERSLNNILADACNELRTSAEDCYKDLMRTFKRKKS